MLNILGPLAAKIRFPSSRQQGSHLVLWALLLPVLVGMTGMGITTGYLAYAQSELQKVADAAVLAGASNYFDGQLSTAPYAMRGNAGRARSIATQVYNQMLGASPALGDFAPSMSVSGNAGNFTTTMTIEGRVNPGLLRVVNLNDIRITATATARPLAYIPNNGAFSVPPRGDSGNIQLSFPITNVAGDDLFIGMPWQPGDAKYRGYMVEVCSGGACNDVTRNGKIFNEPQTRAMLKTIQGRTVAYGPSVYDLRDSQINKGDILVITDDGANNYYDKQGDLYLDTQPAAANFDGIAIFGFAGLCATESACGTPNGLSDYDSLGSLGIRVIP